MEGTSSNDHDRWMEKIARALRSFRMASQLRVDPAQAPGGSPRDGTHDDGHPGGRDVA